MNDDFPLWISSGAFSFLGLWRVAYYDLLSWVALVGGAVVWSVQLRRFHIPLTRQLIALLIIGGVGVVTTRLGHIVFWESARYMRQPGLFLSVSGGRSIHGALLGFVVSAVLIRRYVGVSLSQVADRLAFWPMLGLVLARLGNFANSEMIGTPSTWPVAVRFYYALDRGTVPRHPVVLYEAAFGLVALCVIGVLSVTNWRDRWPFVLSGGVLASYSVTRFVTDTVRLYPGWGLGDRWSTGQWLSLPFLLLGVIMIITGTWAGSRLRGENRPDR